MIVIGIEIPTETTITDLDVEVFMDAKEKQYTLKLSFIHSVDYMYVAIWPST